MKVYNEKDIGNTQEQNTIYVDKKINQIIKHLHGALEALGYDDIMCNDLIWANYLLETLINNLKDENADIVYFSEATENRSKRKTSKSIAENRS